MQLQPSPVESSADVQECTDRLRRGYEYWLAKAAGRVMPSRADIDPAEIKTLLPYVVLIHVQRDPLDFIEKIAGDQVLAHSHRNSMGVPWREFPGRGPDSALWSHMARVLEERMPIVEAVPYVGPQRDFLEVQILSCPLSEDAVTVNKILTIVDYLPRGS